MQEPAPAAPDPARTVVVHLADLRRSRTDSHGIIGFSLGLVQALPTALARHDRLIVLANEEVAAELGTAWQRPGDELRVLPLPRTVAHRLWLDHVAVERAAARAGGDVVVFPKGFLPLGPRRSRASRAVVVHDDIPARALRDGALPWRRRARAAYFTYLLRRSVRLADTCLYVSRFTADQVGRWRSGRAPGVVVHEGISMPEVPLIPLASRHRRAVVFGSAHPHKRIEAGIALAGADPSLAEAVDELVVVGALPRSTRPGRLRLTHLPGPLPTAEVAELIATSRVLLFPSAYEGFGLPPLEAMALGTPALHRLNGAAREVMSGLPGGYDDEDPAAVAAAVAEILVLGDTELAELAHEVRDRYSWTDVACRVAAALPPPPPS